MRDSLPLSLSLSPPPTSTPDWDTHLLLSSDIVAPSSWAFGVGDVCETSILTPFSGCFVLSLRSPTEVHHQLSCFLAHI